MKVITEDDAKFICDVIDGVENRLDEMDKKNIITLFLGHLQEIDTLTVSKLRPMCEDPEVPKNKMSAYVLLYTRNMSVPRISRFDLHNGFDADAKRDGVGWLYLPIYK